MVADMATRITAGRGLVSRSVLRAVDPRPSPRLVRGPADGPPALGEVGQVAERRVELDHLAQRNEPRLARTGRALASVRGAGMKRLGRDRVDERGGGEDEPCQQSLVGQLAAQQVN